MSEYPDRTLVRVARDGNVLKVTHTGNGQTATVWRAGGTWWLEHQMVRTELGKDCACTLPPCQWPTADCYGRGDVPYREGHLTARCHFWHVNRAVVAAASLLSGTIDAAPRHLTLAERRADLARRLRERRS